MVIPIIPVLREHSPFSILPDFFFGLRRKIQSVNRDIPVFVNVLIKDPLRRGYLAGIKKSAKSEVGKKVLVLKRENTPVIKTGPVCGIIFYDKPDMPPPEIEIVPGAKDRDLYYQGIGINVCGGSLGSISLAVNSGLTNKKKKCGNKKNRNHRSFIQN